MGRSSGTQLSPHELHAAIDRILQPDRGEGLARRRLYESRSRLEGGDRGARALAYAGQWDQPPPLLQKKPRGLP